MTGLLSAALVLAGVVLAAGPGAGPAEAADARPLFQLPFPCGERWEAVTRPSHDPNPHSLDMYYLDGPEEGRVIVASAPGTIRKAEFQSGSGWLVSIWHAGGWGTSYMHMLKEPLVEKGQQVDMGTPLGLVGSTGNSGAPHLHYQQWNNSHPDNTVESYFNGVPSGVRPGQNQVFTSHNCGTPEEPSPVTDPVGSAGAVYNLRFYSFFRGTDNRVIQHVHRPNHGWTRPGLGGSVVSPLSSIVHRGDLWVFGRGSSGKLEYRILSGTQWDDWRSLDKPVSGAAGLARLGERLYIVAREGGALKYRYFDEETGWNASGDWLGLGRPAGVTVVSDPVMAVFDGRAALLVRGSDGQLWSRSVRGAEGSTPQWQDWNRLSSEKAVAGNPVAAVGPDENELHVVVRSTDGTIRYHSLAKGWTSWTLDRGLGGSPSGAFAGSPAAISFGGLLTVYARNDAGDLLYRTLDSGGWYPTWRGLGGPAGVALDSSPVAMRNYATRYVAARGADDLLYTRDWRPDSQWGVWTKHGGLHAPMP